MSLEPYTILIILFFTMLLFIWGRWRFDIVALIALMVAVITGAVPFEHIYSGLSNSAVITVACVMVISTAITRSGVLNKLIRKTQSFSKSPMLHVGVLSVVTAAFSAFMNNVGALVLMMPVAIQSALKARRSPALVLMPVALASALGGLTTLIGTPPNLLISNYRQQYTGHPYSFFDFSFVGVPVAIIGVIIIALFLWRLIPTKRKAPRRLEDSFEVQDYITEIRIPEGSSAIDKTVSEFEKEAPADVMILGFVRNKKKTLIVPVDHVLKNNDILIIEATTEKLQELIDSFKLELAGDKKFSSDMLKADDIAIVEAVVPPGSRIEGHSSQDFRLRAKHKLNLLAISREGKPFKERLRQVKLRSGDVVLLQGASVDISENITNLGFLPIVERGLRVTGRRRYLPLIFFAIAILLSASGLLPVQVAFGAVVVLLVFFNLIPLSKLYESIDWPVIILLAAMIPIGSALQTTGGTALIVHYLISISGTLPPTYLLGLLLIFTMTLSDFMNNAATAVVMAPIAASVAQALRLNIDPFLMAVAVGASCSFLTPVGHQNNTLVMGPGGYKFSDYIRLGLPLELIVLITAVPLIIWIWPF